MFLAFGIVYLAIALIMTSVIGYTTYRAFRVKGEYISKKNLLYLAPSFLLIYLLYVTAAFYKEEPLNVFYFITLISNTLDALKFKPQTSLILPLCRALPIYYVDFVIAYILGMVTVILSVASFFSRRIANFFAVRYLFGKNCDVVVGDSEDAIKYAGINKSCVLWATGVKSQRFVDLLKKRVTVYASPFGAKYIRKKLKKGEYNFIFFRSSSYSYTGIINLFRQLDESGCKVFFHLEANGDETKIIREKFIKEVENAENSGITCFSKYELSARKFVEEHPVTKYIPRSFYNENCTLKDDKDINVVFIGFGKVNYRLFRMCAMQFQFAAERDKRLVSKPVNYYVFDNSERALHNEFFARILYEFDEEFKDCDFPKPDKICNLSVEKTDINSVAAKKKFKSLVTENSFTYFIISLECDLEDASYAQTVKRLFGENGNYKIFVRAKNDSGEKLNGDLDDRIIYFGEEKKLYSRESIVNDALTETSMRLNLVYNSIADPPAWLEKLKKMPTEEISSYLDAALKNPENFKLMRKMWNRLPMIEQSSNLYHALNLPFKLNLLGFNTVRRGDGVKGVTEEEFNRRYVNSGRDGGYTDYAFFFGRETCNVLAFTEHARWNALYILYDYGQLKKSDMRVREEVKDGKTRRLLPHKDAARKLHACITTYYGLDELIRFKYALLYPEEKLTEKSFKSDPKLRELSKIYAYDYMDLDRLYAEITAMGYALTEN